MAGRAVARSDEEAGSARLHETLFGCCAHLGLLTAFFGMSTLLYGRTQSGLLSNPLPDWDRRGREREPGGAGGKTARTDADSRDADLVEDSLASAAVSPLP